MSVTNLLAVLGNEDYVVSLQARDHEILADEPTDLGGNDQGLTPYELILASLGACTSVTLKMYAQRKGWQVDDIDVKLQLTIESDSTPIISRKITVNGTLDSEQRERLLQIANACPVHKLLTKPLEVESTITP
jgi:putative redox protein